MKKLIIASISALLLCSFTLVGVGERDSAPGLIQAIGDAGSPQVFTFEKWEFTEASMAEGKIENIQLAIEINTSSLTCDWKDLQNNIRKKKDYFYVKKFPTAKVVIDGATRQADGSYTTEAMLTLKKKTKPVTLTFSISEEAPYQVKGEGLIIRQDFGFTGGGPKDEVPINFDVTLPSDL
ncbi:MAG: YceI family protein [Bacteroidota bacterium]